MASISNGLRKWWNRIRCCRAPAPPSAVTAAMGGGSGEIVITWDPEPDIDRYRVYQRRGTDTWFMVATVGQGAVGLLAPGRLGLVDAPDYWPWPDIGIAGDRCYAVTAVDDHGAESALSIEVCATPG